MHGLLSGGVVRNDLFSEWMVAHPLRPEIGQQRYRVEVRSGGTIAFRVPLHQKMAIGAFSGVIGTCCIFPVDLIKTRLQLAAPGTATVRTVVRQAVKHQGVRGLYTGLSPCLVGVMPEKALKLGVNDYLRDIFCGYDRSQETLANQVVAGALTGIIQAAATNPLEMVKIQQIQAAEQAIGSSCPAPGPMSTLRVLGLRGLYKGSSLTISRDIPYNIVFFTTYIGVKRGLTDQDAHISRRAILLSGVAAGMAAAFVSTPVDVVKTRIQASGSSYTDGTMAACRRIFAEEGARAFFTGAVARMAVQGPLYGIALLTFEVFSGFLGRRHEKEQQAKP